MKMIQRVCCLSLRYSGAWRWYVLCIVLTVCNMGWTNYTWEVFLILVCSFTSVLCLLFGAGKEVTILRFKRHVICLVIFCCLGVCVRYSQLSHSPFVQCPFAPSPLLLYLHLYSVKEYKHYGLCTLWCILWSKHDQPAPSPLQWWIAICYNFGCTYEVHVCAQISTFSYMVFHQALALCVSSHLRCTSQSSILIFDANI